MTVLRNVLVNIFLVALFSQFISSTAAKVILYSDLGITLHNGCSISEDRGTITCNMTFVDHPITMDLKVNKYDDPVSMTASMDVPDLQISWSHTFSFSDTQEVSGRNSSGVYVQVQLTQKSDDLRLNVKLLAKGKTSGQDLHPTEMTVIEGNFLLKSDERGNFEWWHKLTETEKGAVIGGPLFVILFVISISCCCCCKRSNCCSCRCRCR
ncbi:unnamed protein product [Pocillopora meandrina]|uniref:Uncharacterized protein n=1 Tax=Pocillopora meandrina TaxID=46732 RepID=A0AAU9XFX0_9CNID|nr:unnamed protein product [Pocillopora meandrina]